MPLLDYSIASPLLTDSDKGRIVCLYFSSHDLTGIDWKKAARDYGSASVESFKRMLYNMNKRLEAAGSEISAAAGVSTPPNSPPASGAGPRGRKRKLPESSDAKEPVRGRKKQIAEVKESVHVKDEVMKDGNSDGATVSDGSHGGE